MVAMKTCKFSANHWIDLQFHPTQDLIRGQVSIFRAQNLSFLIFLFMAQLGQGFAQTQKMTQGMVLAPQLRQSLKILQSSALELQNVIAEEMEINPVLEDSALSAVSIEDPTYEENGSSGEEGDSGRDEMEILRQLDEDCRDYYSGTNSTNNYDSEDARRRQHFFDSLVSETSLQDHLLYQADLSGLSPAEKEAMEYLIGSLDDRGFLTTSLSDLALYAGIPLGTVQAMGDLLKTFDPTGIGAKDLRECLLLQLAPNHPPGSVPYRIIQDHFDLLMRRRIPDIARRLGVTIDDIQDALEDISTCDPAPGRKFSADNNRTVSEDVTVDFDGENVSISLNSDYIPRLRISQTYKEMLASGKLARKEREFIREKIRSGKFLISSIEQRQQTLERITREIMKVQIDFLREGVAKLRPLTMTQVAQEVGVHETTVSRAIANKYVRTPHGLFEFKYFFTPGYQGEDGESVSNKSIKDMIRTLVDGESPQKPLSDQKIVELLQEKNITIARRTVAKYRESMGILPAKLRRQY